MSDVVLFVSTPGGSGRLYTVNPFTGDLVTNVGGLGGSGYGYGDIAMRNDGTLFGQTLGTNNANSGNFRRIDTGNASQTNIGDDGIGTNPNRGGEWVAVSSLSGGTAIPLPDPCRRRTPKQQPGSS